MAALVGRAGSIGGFRWLTSESDSMLREKTGSAGNFTSWFGDGLLDGLV